MVELLVEQRIRQAESPLGLGPRELEVLKEMAEGKTNAAIGETLHLSESAIEKYVNAIFAKLGLSAEPKISRRVVAVLAYLRDLDRANLSRARTSSPRRRNKQPTVPPTYPSPTMAEQLLPGLLASVRATVAPVATPEEGSSGRTRQPAQVR